MSLEVSEWLELSVRHETTRAKYEQGAAKLGVGQLIEIPDRQEQPEQQHQALAEHHELEAPRDVDPEVEDADIDDEPLDRDTETRVLGNAIAFGGPLRNRRRSL